jgi:hypothetical protein
MSTLSEQLLSINLSDAGSFTDQEFIHEIDPTNSLEPTTFTLTDCNVWYNSKVSDLYTLTKEEDILRLFHKEVICNHTIYRSKIREPGIMEIFFSKKRSLIETALSWSNLQDETGTYIESNSHQSISYRVCGEHKGVRHGPSKYYDDNGQLLRCEVYMLGKLISN